MFKIAGMAEFLLVTLTTIILLLGGVYTAVKIEGDFEDLTGRLLFLRNILIGLSLGFVISLVTYLGAPSKEDALWIAGGHIATNIDGVGDIPENAVKAVNVFLESLAEKEE